MNQLVGTKKNKKAILLVRVSTDEQTLDEQERELYDLAQRDGYDRDHILSIAHKESAIKLSEEERLGLNEMKWAIETGEYDAVYVWEISRIARTRKVLFSIHSYLVEHKIQLVVKSINLSLLNCDGTVNQSADIAFSIWAQMAEAEIQNKEDRFRRGKKQKAREGKYSGGYIPFGYDYERENGNLFIIKEEEAQVVRRTFELYESGYSMISTAEKLQSEGHNIKFSLVSKILKNRSYTGELYSPRKGFNERRYPQIITVEQFDRCRAIAEENKRWTGKNIYLAKALVRCPDCGSLWTASGSRTCYSCYEAKKGKRAFNAELTGRTKCTNTASISINVLDSLLWEVAVRCEAWQLAHIGDSEEVKIKSEIEKINAAMAEATKKAEVIAEKRSFIFTAYFTDYMITRERYDIEREKLKEQAKVIKGEMQTLERLKSNLEVKLNRTQAEIRLKGNVGNNIEELYNTMMGYTDEKAISEIIHRQIERVDIKPIEFEYNFTRRGKKMTKGKFIRIYPLRYIQAHSFTKEKSDSPSFDFIHLPYDGKGGHTILPVCINEGHMIVEEQPLEYRLTTRFVDPRKVAQKEERARRRAARVK